MLKEVCHDWLWVGNDGVWTSYENGSLDTDHGRGFAMLAMDHGIKGIVNLTS